MASTGWFLDCLIVAGLYIVLTINGCGKVMFSQASVILFTGGGVLQIPPRADTPSLGQKPPRQTSPGRQPSRRLLQRTVRTLLECILVDVCFLTPQFLRIKF